MAILNITPDSFSDGGRFFAAGKLRREHILRQAEAMALAGADIFDVGGESTRPGAAPVSEAEELDRVVPVVSLLREHFSLPVSVDTSCPAVIAHATAAGASMINDVRALTRPGALEAAAHSGLPVCLMHTRGEPGEMQGLASYGDVVAEVRDYLRQRVAACRAAGIAAPAIAIDPGFGFAKTLAHNLALFRALDVFVAEGFPVLVGVSRKRMVGELLDREVDERLAGSLALALLAAGKGVRMIRVHDVPQTVDVLKILAAVEAG